MSWGGGWYFLLSTDLEVQNESFERGNAWEVLFIRRRCPHLCIAHGLVFKSCLGFSYMNKKRDSKNQKKKKKVKKAAAELVHHQ